MREIKSTVGIHFDDQSLEAKAKMMDFAEALRRLTLEQRGQPANEVLDFTGLAASFEQFVSYTNGKGVQ